MAAAVVNASPLIFLAKLQSLDALRLFDPIVTTPEALAEVEAGLEQGYREALAVRRWLQEGFIEVRKAPPLGLPPPVLGSGELSVISLAVSLTRVTAILDDRAGIRAAKHLGIRVRSTPFVLLDNLAAGRITVGRFRSTLDALLALDYRISPALFLELVQLGDEVAQQ